MRYLYKYSRQLIVVALVFLINVSNLIAQKDSIKTDDIFKLSLEELMDIEVYSASNIITELKKQPVSMTSISEEQLILSGSRTLLEAIMMYVPGFFIVEDQDDLIAGFRGLAPDNNLKAMLLLDGQVMNSEWFFGAPSAILNTTNYEFIHKVEIIRGPGSVTLGQGALLGVINIVTKSGTSMQNNAQSLNAKAYATVGMDGFYSSGLNAGFSNQEIDGFIKLGAGYYYGQELRNEGWASDKDNEGYKDGNIVDIGTRLKANKNINAHGNINVGDLRFNFMFFNHEKDLYNFYRDRNQFRQTLSSVGVTYQKDFTDILAMRVSIDGSIDDFELSSVDNYIMGGTRENRYGAKLLFNINEIVFNNKLAVGFEFRRFEFGRSNFSGNNFINNMIDNSVINDYDNYIADANATKIWGYEDNLNVVSAFAEDFYSINEKIDLFGAVRFDLHPYWGANFSPRVGVLTYPTDNLLIRLSYQTGFRGAAGVHYGGGYRMDGFLRAANYDQVSATEIPIYDESNNIIDYEDNIPAVKPELMKSTELAIDYRISDNFNVNVVGFYNIVENVIDVGVFWRDASVYSFSNIGTDVPGDWNGYWYYKNTKGQIVETGSEISLSYKTNNIMTNLSHSFVTILSADEQQLSSMYLTSQQNFKAFPENVTRMNIIAQLNSWFSLGTNYLYYYSWFSPRDQQQPANHLVNLSARFSVNEKFYMSVNAVNLLNQQKLYPMNSNAGGEDLSDGTPSVESTSIWLKATVKLN